MRRREEEVEGGEEEVEGGRRRRMENIRLRFCGCTVLFMGVATVLSSTLDGVLTEMASEWRNEATIML